VSASVLANGEHLSQMRLRLGMALETVLVTTLLLADLTVPPQALEALGLHLVRQVLWRSNYDARLVLRSRPIYSIQLTLCARHGKDLIW
jgi:hypothetical protein